MTIRNPVEWGYDAIRETVHGLGHTAHDWKRPREALSDIPVVQRITAADIRDALSKGLADFGACRTDVIFIAFVYPLAGLVLAHVALHNEMLPLLFPLISGFALIGPFAAAGLYEMSRRRELGLEVSWSDSMAVLNRPSFGAFVGLGLLLTAIFVVWLAVAMGIYWLIFGAHMPASITDFARQIFTTSEGWALMIVGVSVGFLFALLVLTISVVSFPLLLDRNVTLRTAIESSVRAVMMNPGPMLLWGMIVACGLVLGTIPLLLGLIVVMPVLGHATWHLYRKVLQ
ncbi:DUF2189 domain-containing protein [Flaviflagellibacter deserti]|uniref:DUF2189 domain-containing protein n=1 Tax=Flaviflagellibacter deserti TaxID=2267266 RepID=A0ABV9Z3H7_9HYPH